MHNKGNIGDQVSVKINTLEAHKQWDGGGQFELTAKFTISIRPSVSSAKKKLENMSSYLLTKYSGLAVWHLTW